MNGVRVGRRTDEDGFLAAFLEIAADDAADGAARGANVAVMSKFDLWVVTVQVTGCSGLWKM